MCIVIYSSFICLILDLSANEDLHSSFEFDSGGLQKRVMLGSQSVMLFRA